MAAPFDPHALLLLVRSALEQASQPASPLASQPTSQQPLPSPVAGPAWEPAWANVTPQTLPLETKAALSDRLQQSLRQSGESLQQAKIQLSGQIGEQLSQRSQQVRQGAEGLGQRLDEVLADRLPDDLTAHWPDSLGTGLGDRLHQLQAWLSLPAQRWLGEHRLVVWATAHPVGAVFGGLLLAVLSFNLLKLVLNPANWLKLFSLPWRPAKLGLGDEEEVLYLEQTLQPGELRKGEINALLGRLEALNKEQEILHEQLRLLLGGQPRG